MARSKADLSSAVLVELGVLDALHSASAEDAALVEARYDDKLEELRDKGLVYWTHTSRTSEDIPSAVFRAITLIMAAEVAASFGQPQPTVVDDNNQPVSAAVKGIRELRRHMAKGPSGEPTRAVFY
jgi:hypothetical protein